MAVSVNHFSPPLSTQIHFSAKEFSGICPQLMHNQGFPGGSDSEESSCNAGDLGLIPKLGRSSGEGNGYPLQYSSLEDSMNRGAWWAIVHEVAKSWT